VDDESTDDDEPVLDTHNTRVQYQDQDNSEHGEDEELATQRKSILYLAKGAMLTKEHFRRLQRTDYFCDDVINYVIHKKLPDESSDALQILSVADQYTVNENGMLQLVDDEVK
jgi:hypothetical protein